MDKRKKKKAAVGETALPKGVPFDRQRERPLKWGIAIFKGGSAGRADRCGRRLRCRFC